MSDQDQPQTQASGEGGGQESPQPRRESTQQAQQPQGERGNLHRRGPSGGGGGGGGRGRRHSGGGSGGGGRQPGQPGGGGGGQQSSSRRGQTDEASLNMSELRELVDLFTTNGLAEFEFENAEIRVRLSKNLTPPAGVMTVAAPQVVHQAQQQQQSQGGGVPAQQSSSAAQESSSTAAPEPADDLHVITSPIVGTFYRSSSPTADPFVRVGSQVAPETTVCIIEAMKLMNEIQAETSGTVEKIFVENGQPVEYGQPLFGVKK